MKVKVNTVVKFLEILFLLATFSFAQSLGNLPSIEPEREVNAKILSDIRQNNRIILDIIDTFP